MRNLYYGLERLLWHSGNLSHSSVPSFSSPLSHATCSTHGHGQRQWRLQRQRRQWQKGPTAKKTTTKTTTTKKTTTKITLTMTTKTTANIHVCIRLEINISPSLTSSQILSSADPQDKKPLFLFLRTGASSEGVGDHKVCQEQLSMLHQDSTRKLMSLYFLHL